MPLTPLHHPVAYFIYKLERWGRLVGWGVFRQREDRLVWGDALFDPRHALAAECLLAEVLARPEHAASRRIEAWFSARPEWWSRIVDRLGFELPPRRRYGVAMLFLPQDAALRSRCEQLFVEQVRREGLEVLGWRDVPTDNSSLGEIARSAEPVVRQAFIDGLGLEDEPSHLV